MINTYPIAIVVALTCAAPVVAQTAQDAGAGAGRGVASSSAQHVSNPEQQVMDLQNLPNLQTLPLDLPRLELDLLDLSRFTMPAMDLSHLAMESMDLSQVAIDAVDVTRLALEPMRLHSLLMFDSPMLHPQDREQREREAERRERDREREQDAYENAQEALDEGRYDRAIERFGEVAAMKASRADAALYWKAFAQDRQGQRAEALTTIAELVKTHPNSRYISQAKALEVEVRRNVGQPVRPENQADDEVKLMALNALQHSDPEQAIPMLEKLLQGTASPKLKDRALFVLAQSSSPRAREVLTGIAKGNSTPELQTKAIQYLGIHGGRESRAVLGEIYGATTDVSVKRRILRAFMVSGERSRLLTAAQSEQNPELRAEAVRQLGVMGAHDELWQLYQKEASPDVKKQILHAMFVGGNSTRLIELARTEQNIELRRTAVRNLGLMGAKGTGQALVDIYGSDRDMSIRKAVVNALFLQDNATSLVALARKEDNPELKKEIVQKLSLMRSKVATDYMMELLNAR